MVAATIGRGSMELGALEKIAAAVLAAIPLGYGAWRVWKRDRSVDRDDAVFGRSTETVVKQYEGVVERLEKQAVASAAQIEALRAKVDQLYANALNQQQRIGHLESQNAIKDRAISMLLRDMRALKTGHMSLEDINTEIYAAGLHGGH